MVTLLMGGASVGCGSMYARRSSGIAVERGRVLVLHLDINVGLEVSVRVHHWIACLLPIGDVVLQHGHLVTMRRPLWSLPVVTMFRRIRVPFMCSDPPRMADAVASWYSRQFRLPFPGRRGRSSDIDWEKSGGVGAEPCHTQAPSDRRYVMGQTVC